MTGDQRREPRFGGSRRKGRLPMAAMAAVLGAASAAGAQEPGALGPQPGLEEMWRIIAEQERRMEALEAGIAAGVAPAAGTPPAVQSEVERLSRELAETNLRLEAMADTIEARGARPAGLAGWWERTSLGGYGSIRYEASSLDEQDTTFTFRRFVLAVDSRVTSRLRTYLELEFERFTQLELEKSVAAGGGEFEVEQEIEGTSGSEISVEQAWARYTISPELNVDIGALLVPLGRFNIKHDDNLWNLPRRTLVDRGAPVLPAKAAWAELGGGFSGIVPVGAGGSLLSYQLYAVNGVALDFELEEILKAKLEGSGEVELENKFEAKFTTSRGPFDKDLNDDIAVTGRLALQPAPGQEFAVSGYFGNYVPKSFGTNENVWSIGIDGLHTFAGFEVEYEAVTTHFDDLNQTVAAFASRALTKERAIEGPVEGGAFAKNEVEFTIAKNVMADNKTGYWVEFRRPFWPEALSDSFLGRGFADPQIIPTLRFEQVFFDDQLTGIEFENGLVTEFNNRDAVINRATFGFAYRPVPQWAFQIAAEYTWTEEDSLDGLTNFLNAGGEDDAVSVLIGVAFGF